MAIYKNITTTGITTLIPKSPRRKNAASGGVNKITFSNNSASNEATISLQIWDGTSVGYNIFGNLKLPAGVTLVVDDNLSFDTSAYSLRVEVTGTSPLIDVIIK
jgi:hypothetical protein